MKYLGNKQKLLDFIDKVIVENNIVSGTFCDLFSGTAIVGQHFKEKGFKIISNDYMYYSYILQYVKIKINSYPMFDGMSLNSSRPRERCQEIIDYLNSLYGLKGFIYNNYTLVSKEERAYYTRENATIIDTMLLYIRSNFEDNKITYDEMLFLLCAVIEAMPDYANTTGTFTSYLKSFTPQAKRKFEIKLPTIIESNTEHLCYNEDAAKLINDIECDILYIDPPYSNISYSSYYHILETVAKDDNPKIKGKTGMRENNLSSDFNSIKKSYNAFKKLIINANAKFILFSYNSEGLLSKDEIIDLLKIKGTVKVYCQKHRRYKADNRKYKMAENELLEYLFFVKVEESTQIRQLRKAYLHHPRN